MSTLWTIASILGTVAVYWASKKVYARRPSVLLSPILITPLGVMMLLRLLHVSYDTYNEGAKWLTYLLGPATVAFAVPMHKHVHLLKRHGAEIMLGVAAGSLVAIVSSLFLSLWVRLGSPVIESMLPRSVTTPIAMDLSKAIGGNPTLTAVFVLLTGLTGSILGPLVIRLLPIRTPAAKGIMFGMGAHGTGTSKAFELGELEGTFSSLSMIVAAGITSIMVYWLVPALQVKWIP